MSNDADLADPCQARLPSPDEAARLQEEGYAILRGLARPEAIGPLREEVLAVVRARNLADSFLGQSHEYLAGSLLQRWVHSPRLKALAEACMGGPSSLYLPFTAVKGPRQGRFTFHQDNQYTPHRGPGSPFSLNIWTALVPMSVANGCLQVVPRSHRDGTLASAASGDCPGHRMVAGEPASWVDCVMDAGDAVVFSRLNVHGSGPNSTDAPRVAYAVQFHRDDTEALIDGTWAPLRLRPRWPESLRPVAALSREPQRGE